LLLKRSNSGDRRWQEILIGSAILKLAPPIWTFIYILLCVAVSWSLGWPTIPGLPVLLTAS
jgi:hypothetical protein